MNPLGKGSFGSVYVVDKDVARKDFSDYRNYSDYNFIEVATLQHLRNVPHVVQICGMAKIKRGLPCGFYMERHTGSLGGMGVVTLDWDVQKIVGQLLVAVKHIHSIGIAHRDITLANILIDKNGDAVLCDFSNAALVDIVGDDVSLLSETTTKIYMPPYKRKVKRVSKRATLSADIWSCGIIALQLELKKIKITYHDYTKLKEGDQKDAIKEMFELDYQKAKTAAELLKSPYFSWVNVADVSIPRRETIQETPGFDTIVIINFEECFPMGVWNNYKVACLGLATNLFRRHVVKGYDKRILSAACMYLAIRCMTRDTPTCSDDVILLSNNITKEDQYDWIPLIPQMNGAKTWTRDEVYNMFGF